MKSWESSVSKRLMKTFPRWEFHQATFKDLREMLLCNLREMTNNIFILKTKEEKSDSDVSVQKYYTMTEERKIEHRLKRERRANSHRVKSLYNQRNSIIMTDDRVRDMITKEIKCHLHRKSKDMEQLWRAPWLWARTQVNKW